MIRRAAGLLAILLLTLAAAPLRSQVVLKMATMVPENTSWFRIIKDMGDTWGRLSGGRVKVVFYPGGRMGDDSDAVRKMRLGSLHGAVLTTPGLAEIDRAVYALSVPLAYESTDEVYGVLDKVRPGLEGAMLAKGFVVLNWLDAGWVRIFARRPVARPDDLRRQKLFQWSGDPQTMEIWKSLGFNVISAPAPELATGLQTGLMDAFLASPEVALITRNFEHARTMTDVKWAIILASTVVTRDAWNRVPADVRPALQKSAQETGIRLRAEMRETDGKDLQAMRQAGLQVVPVDAKGRELWNQLLHGAQGKIRGAFVPAPAYDEAMAARDALRRHGK